MPRQGDPQIVADERIERRVQLWMRAYPRRWREERGEELLGLVVDLAGPAARHLGADAAFDLLRGGLATRWREHPPLHTWLLYRLFDRRIPEAYRSWALNDIDGFWYPIRRNGFSLAIIYAFSYALQVGDPMSSVPPAWHYLVWGLVMAVSWLILWPEVGRDRARLKHVSPHSGEPRAEGALVPWDVPRERVAAPSMLHWAIPLLGTPGQRLPHLLTAQGSGAEGDGLLEDAGSRCVPGNGRRPCGWGLGRRGGATCRGTRAWGAGRGARPAAAGPTSW